MKCQYCGGNLSLEDEYCPHCGKPNENAIQHIKDMKHYQSDYEDTRSHVYTITKNYSGITVRAVIIAVLVILVVVFAVVNAESYSIKYGLRQSEAKRKAVQYSKQLDKYIEEENYFAFWSFCEAHNIDGYRDSFEAYRPVMEISRIYVYLYQNMMQLHTSDTEEEFQNYLKATGNYLEQFYEGLDMEKYKYSEGSDNEQNRRALAQIKERVDALLTAYCGLTEEEAAQFGELSEIKRMVLIEERMQYEE